MRRIILFLNIKFKMQQALIQIENDDDALIEDEGRIITPAEYKRLLDLGHITGDEELRHPSDGGQLVFRGSYQRVGKTISPSFAYAKGQAPSYGLSSPQKYNSIEAALKDGAKILIDLSELDLSYASLDFSKAADPNMISTAGWKIANEKHLIISSRSITDVIANIKKVAEHGASPNETVSVLYHGGVLPYQEFYLARSEPKISDLYDGLKAGTLGQQWGKNQVGFPRMMRFTITESTLREAGKIDIKGNLIQHRPRSLFSTIFLNGKNKKAGLAQAWEIVAAGRGEFYVIGCPSYSAERDQAKKMDNLRWLVNAPSKQMSALKNNSTSPFPLARFIK